MKLVPSPRTVALAGAVVALGSLPFVTSPASAEGPATTTYTKTLSYTCDVDTVVFGGPFTVTNQPVKAAISFTAPSVLPINGTVPPVDINVALTLPESLQAASTGFLNGVAADGASTNVYLIERSLQGERQVFSIPKLSAPKGAIPERGVPWVINATGTSSEITVLNTTRATFSAPEKFDIDATIYKSDDTTAPARLTCETEGDRTVASIPVGEATTQKIIVPSKIRPGTTGNTAVVQVRGAATKPTGYVYLYLDDDLENPVGGGELNKNSGIRITLPKLGKVGTRKLTAVYGGDPSHGAVTTTQTFLVSRR